MESGVITYYMAVIWTRVCHRCRILAGRAWRGFILDTVMGTEVQALSGETAMQSKHSNQVSKASATAVADPAAASADLGSALVEFARRLANFGLGEAETPILNEFVDRRRHPRIQT